MSKTLPWTVKIETTEGCNRSCHFCPVPIIYGKHYNFLTPEIAGRIADQLLEWQPERKWRFELAMLGEPTINKNLPDILRQLRRIKKAQITVFSNGDIIKHKLDLLPELYNSGLNILGVDCYDDENLKFYTELEPGHGIKKWNYFDNSYKLYANKPGGFEFRHMVIINDLATSQDKPHLVRKISNFGGNVDNSKYGAPIDVKVKAGCEKPFRDLVVSHAGDVLVCCMDANKDLKIGNIFDSTLPEIWYGEKYMDVRRSLAKGERIGRPCDGCSYFGGFKRFLAFNDFKELMK